VLQEIDSIEVSKTSEETPADDGIDGIPISTDSAAATVVTAADSEKKVSEKVSKKVSEKVSRRTSSQPANDVDSGDEDEWKGVAPQGLLQSVIVAAAASTFSFCLTA